MNKILFILLVIVVTCNPQLSWSQEPTNNIPNPLEVQKIPSSPDAGALGVYGNTNINKYNGTANIAIPIHTIAFDGISIPIALNYNTSGITVEQEASWVGLGWNLSEGISITREINGYDDLNTYSATHQYVGWIHTERYLWPSEENNFTGDMQPEDFQFLESQHQINEPHDTEPDLFSVVVPSGSFDFYLPKIQTGQQELIVSPINEANFKGTYNIANQIFTIIDPQGFTYYFDIAELSTGFQNYDSPTASTEQGAIDGVTYQSIMRQGKKIIKTWKVSQIDSPYGRSLYFEYDPGFYFSFPHFSESFIYGANRPDAIHNVPVTSPSRLAVNLYAFEVFYLKKITGDFGEVQFNYPTSDNRKDLYSKEAQRIWSGLASWNPTLVVHSNIGTNNLAKALQSVTVLNSQGSVVKNAMFYQSYFNSASWENGNVLDEATYLRLKLDSVAVQDRMYRFDYYSPIVNSYVLPPKNSKDVDFWGYYNGMGNAVRIPNSNRFYLSTTPITINGTTYTSYENFYKFSGAIKKSDINYGIYGLLTKVVYPTGGYTEFEYEGNTAVLQRIGYSPTNFTNGRIQKSGLASSESYNFNYQYLKLANDPSYTLWDYNSCSVTSTPNISNNEQFTISSTSFCNDQDFNVKVVSTLTCSNNCANISPSGDATWIENVATGAVYKLVDFSQWQYNQQFPSSPFPPIENELMLPAGTYVFKYNPAWSQGSDFITNSAHATIYEDTSSMVTVNEEFQAGGARLKKITNRDLNDNFISSKKFLYYQPDEFGNVLSGGKLMDELIYSYRGAEIYEYTPEQFGSDLTLTSDNRLRTQPSASGNHIGYGLVIEQDIDSVGTSKGSIHTTYFNKSNKYHERLGVSDPNPGIGYGKVYLMSMSPVTYTHLNGNILKEVVLDAFNDTIRVMDNVFKEFKINTITNSAIPYPVIQFFIASPNNAGYNSNYPAHEVDFGYNLGTNNLTRLDSTVTTEILNNKEIVTITKQAYNSSYQLSRTVRENSKGEVTTTNTFYPKDLTSYPFMTDLIDENRVNQPVKLETYLGTNAFPEQDTLQIQRTVYADDLSSNGLVLLKEIYSRKGESIVGNQEELRQVYEKYDTSGNPLQYRKADGIPVSYLRGYNDLYPVVKIENADHTTTLNSVNSALPGSFTSLEGLVTTLGDIQNNTSQQTDWRYFNDTLRASLPGAMITTYTYDPLVGVTSITDSRGYTQYYLYDTANRLSEVRDADNHIITDYKYQYTTP